MVCWLVVLKLHLYENLPMTLPERTSKQTRSDSHSYLYESLENCCSLNCLGVYFFLSLCLSLSLINRTGTNHASTAIFVRWFSRPTIMLAIRRGPTVKCECRMLFPDVSRTILIKKKHLLLLLFSKDRPLHQLFWTTQLSLLLLRSYITEWSSF